MVRTHRGTVRRSGALLAFWLALDLGLAVAAPPVGPDERRPAGRQSGQPAALAAEQARRDYLQALRLMESEDYTRALPLFEIAHQRLGLRNALWNLAECRARLGRSARAIDAFRAFASHPRTTPAEREEAGRRIGQLQASVVRLTVQGSPGGAEVRLDGRVAGRLPLVLEVDPGQRLLEISSPGFATRREAILVAGGQSTRRDVALTLLPALVKVATTPSHAEVWLAGARVGRAPLTVQQPPGTFGVEVRLEGYRPQRRQVSVVPGAEVHLALELERPSSQLRLRTEVVGARVWLGQRLLGVTPLPVVGVTPGPATLRVERAGFQAWSGRLELRDLESVQVAVRLQRGQLDRRWFGLTAALAGATLVSGAALLGAAHAESGRYEQVRPQVLLPTGLTGAQLRDRAAEASALRASALRYNQAGIGLLSASGAATAAAATLFFFTRWQPSRADIQVSPALGGAQVAGTWP